MKVFSLEFLLTDFSGSCAVIVRFPYVVALEKNATDFLYYATNVVLWTSIEPGLAITASSLATLRPLFHTFLGNHGSSSDTKASANCMSMGKSRSGKSMTGGYIQSGAGCDQRSHPTQYDTELDDFGGEKSAFRSVVTTTIMSPATPSNRTMSIRRSPSQEAFKRGDRVEGDLGPAPLSPASLHPSHGGWPTRITKTIEVRTQSSQAEYVE